MSDRSITYKKEVLHYTDEGEGKVIVFVHGWQLSKETWRSVATHFARAGYRCIAIDLPGFGKSHTNHSWTLDDYAAAILHVVTELGIKQYALVGHSFGAKCAVIVAAKSPKAIEKLVLISGNLGLARRSLLWLPINLALRTRLPRHMKQTYRLTHDYDFRPSLGNISAPALIIHGKYDTVVPVRNARTVAELLPGSVLIIVRAWHMPYKEQRAQTLSQLDSFLRS